MKGRMEVICVGGPYHGLVVDLPEQQDIYRPTGELRPRYQKLLQSGSRSRAYFAFSELSDLEAHELVMEHIRSFSGYSALERDREANGSTGVSA